MGRQQQGFSAAAIIVLAGAQDVCQQESNSDHNSLMQATHLDIHAHASSGPACPDYFGPDTDGAITTVVDKDVGLTGASAGYCMASGLGKDEHGNSNLEPCTYVHHATGVTDGSCHPPGPPDGCHRYHKVTYSSCDELKNYKFTNIADQLTDRLDVDHQFNEQGVFKACAENMLTNEVSCWGPPGADPKQCSCPFSAADDAIPVGTLSLNTKTPTKGLCSAFFGKVGISGVTTVVDPDVGLTATTAGYCMGSGLGMDENGDSNLEPCTYVHHADGATDGDCHPPGPPDGCHRYYKVTYSSCDELRNYGTNRIDAKHQFNEQGVFKACASKVVSSSMSCCGPHPVFGGESPQQCTCPE